MTGPPGFEFTSFFALDHPVLVVGFSGWPDAGEVSTQTLRFLTVTLGAHPIASIPVDPFHDYGARRPSGVIREGELTELELPAIELSCAAGAHGPDLLLLDGPEPHLNWGGLAGAILDVCQRFGVPLILTVGGTYDAVPHTVEPPVSGVANSPEVLDRFRDRVELLGEYRGPVSFHSYLSHRAAERGIEALSLWGHAPSYIQTGNLAVVARMLEVIAGVLDLDIDHAGLRRSSDEMLGQVNELMAGNPKLKTYVRRLEKEFAQRSGRLDADDRKVISLAAFIKKNEDPAGS
jgi:proteasome assembly chaperone (PAC2) family protein